MKANGETSMRARTALVLRFSGVGFRVSALDEAFPPGIPKASRLGQGEEVVKKLVRA